MQVSQLREGEHQHRDITLVLGRMFQKASRLGLQGPEPGLHELRNRVASVHLGSYQSQNEVKITQGQ